MLGNVSFCLGQEYWITFSSYVSMYFQATFLCSIKQLCRLWIELQLVTTLCPALGNVHEWGWHVERECGYWPERTHLSQLPKVWYLWEKASVCSDLSQFSLMACVLEMPSFPSSYKESGPCLLRVELFSAWMDKVVETKVHPKDVDCLKPTSST